MSATQKQTAEEAPTEKVYSLNETVYGFLLSNMIFERLCDGREIHILPDGDRAKECASEIVDYVIAPIKLQADHFGDGLEKAIKQLEKLGVKTFAEINEDDLNDLNLDVFNNHENRKTMLNLMRISFQSAKGYSKDFDQWIAEVKRKAELL